MALNSNSQSNIACQCQPSVFWKYLSHLSLTLERLARITSHFKAKGIHTVQYLKHSNGTRILCISNLINKMKTYCRMQIHWITKVIQNYNNLCQQNSDKNILLKYAIFTDKTTFTNVLRHSIKFCINFNQASLQVLD